MFRQMTKEKESGLTKLIELLNEYDGKNHWWDYDEEYLTSEEFYGENGDLEIISKKFGFIKWLVENEKLKWTNKMEMRKIMLGMPEKQDYYIMMLAVTPQPIEFLISILK